MSHVISPEQSLGTGPRFYRPELDVLRFLAFLLVFMHHCMTAQSDLGRAVVVGGQSGVCLFFLLSAYLITELLEREETQTRQIDLKSFYIRRVLRIWPLYFAALLLARLIDFHAPHLQMPNGRLIASVLLAGNWYTYWHGQPASFALVLWSVSVEEQFYLFWPSVRKFLGSRGLLTMTLLTFPVSYAAIVWLCDRSRLDIQLWVNTFVQVQFFGLGGLLALQLRGRSPRWSMWVRVPLFFGGLLAFFGSEYFFHGATLYSSPANAVREYLMMVAGSVMLFCSVLGLSELRHAKFLIYLGRISYGLYVFHLLGLRVAQRFVSLVAGNLAPTSVRAQCIELPVAMALTIFIAHLSYRFFEAPFLRLKGNFTVVKSRFI